MKKYVYDNEEIRRAEVEILKNIIDEALEPRGPGDLDVLSHLPTRSVRARLVKLIRNLEKSPNSLLDGVDIQDLDEEQICRLLEIMYPIDLYAP